MPSHKRAHETAEDEPAAGDAEDRPPSGIVSELPTKEKLARLGQLVSGRRRALILTHDNPDPDSLAAALALAHLLEHRANLPCRIAYGGIVGRAENTAMIRVLHLPVLPATRVDFSQEDVLALVDTQPQAKNHSLPAGLTPDIVIDHHPARDGIEQVPFADVGHSGATCSILVEYLRAARMALSTEVATALFYGIKADTRDLGRQTFQVDIDSYLYLLPRVDKDALAQIEHPALPARYFRLYNLAIEKARVHQNAVEVDLGEIYSPDMVAEVAERMLSLEGMKWSLAYGSYQGQLFLSIRTRDRRMNAGRLIREICEDLGGSSGGHGSMAGARLPLHGTRDQRRRLKRSLVSRFLSEFGVHDRKGQKLLALG
ncbi:MAG: DHH family phosphoesterase [Deltaproteobacteria bacterium]|nr:DHH family phosphoesterase [Deltaproteobacteria bacterium]